MLHLTQHTAATRRRRRLVVPAAALALALGVAACGDDDDEDASATTTTEEQTTTTAADAASGDLAAFCDAVVALDTTLVAGGPQGPDPDQADEAIQTLQDTAPEEISQTVDQTAELARMGFAGDESIFEGPEFTEGDRAVDQFALDRCSFNEMDVTAVDYGFEGIPETVEAGQVAVTLTNEGEEEHEVILLRINDDVTEPFEELLQLPEEEALSMVTIAGGAFASPTESSTAFADLEPGRYGAVCFLTVGTTAETEGQGPPHFTEGMLAEFTVE